MTQTSVINTIKPQKNATRKDGHLRYATARATRNGVRSRSRAFLAFKRSSTNRQASKGTRKPHTTQNKRLRPVADCREQRHWK